MINDKTIAGTNSMGNGSYMPEKKREESTRYSGGVHGLLPATENFVSATNYLWCKDGSLSGVGQQRITESPPLIFFNAGFFNGGLRLFFLMLPAVDSYLVLP